MLAFTHIASETLDVAPPEHEPYNQAGSDPQSGFDQRVGLDLFDPSVGTLKEDPDAPDPQDADGVASLRQSAACSANRPCRVVNAGLYTASFNVLSLGVSYRF